MSKTLDSLSTFHRVLILVSATLILFGVSLRANPFPFNNAVYELELVERQYNQLRSVVRAEANKAYRPQLAAAVAGGSPWLQTMVSRASFYPGHLWIGMQPNCGSDEDPDRWYLPMLLSRVTLIQMKNLPDTRICNAWYPIFDINPNKLIERMAEIDRARLPLYEATDLQVTISNWEPRRNECLLYFRSPELERGGEPGWSFWLPCSMEQQVGDTTAALMGLFVQEETLNHDGIYSPVGFDSLFYDSAKAQMRLRAAQETGRRDDVDIGGFKLTQQMAVYIGPLIIMYILFTMISYNGILKERLVGREDEAASWLGMSRGTRIAGMAVTTLVLPVVSTATILSAVYEKPENLSEELPWYSYDMLWSQKYFVCGTGVVLLFAGWFVIASILSARQWSYGVARTSRSAK